MIFIVVTASLLFRHMDAFTNPQLWAEAGTEIFMHWENMHFGSFLVIYAGYFMTVQRCIAAIIGLLHINFLYIPTAYNYAAWLVTCLVAVALYDSATKLKIKHSVFYATMFVLLPIGNELFMDEASLQWMTGIYLVHYLSVWDNRDDERYYWFHLVLLFIFSTSGPYAAVLLPVTVAIIALNLRNTPLKRLIPLFVVLAGGSIQMYCIKFVQPLALKGRLDSWNSVPADNNHFLQLFTKNIIEICYLNKLPGVGETAQFWMAIVILAALAVFFAMSFKRAKGRRKYILAASGALCFASFVMTYWTKESQILSLGIARYYFLPYACLGWLLISAWDDKLNMLWMVGCVAFVFGHFNYLRTSFPDTNWKGQVREFYSGRRDTLKILPDGWNSDHFLIVPRK